LWILAKTAHSNVMQQKSIYYSPLAAWSLLTNFIMSGNHQIPHSSTKAFEILYLVRLSTEIYAFFAKLC
jgi:hypothetical protein